MGQHQLFGNLRIGNNSYLSGMKSKLKMMKRADGSYSPRGLWDNIRANKGSGKAPTPEMLKQEKKIKAQEKKQLCHQKLGKEKKVKILKVV